jgi:hypothetical protein
MRRTLIAVEICCHLVNAVERPALFCAPLLQLAVNLFDFCHMGCTQHISGQDCEQYVNQYVRRHGCQLSEHALRPLSEVKIHFCDRNLRAISRDVQVDESRGA